MKAHWQYLRYVVRHKWFVFLVGIKLGVPIWRLLIHDWSKFLPSEWFPYVHHFYGKPRIATKEGYLHNPLEAEEAFNLAWNRHQKRHDHHWQWWVILMDDGKIECLEMSFPAMNEMLADWIGAGRAQGSAPVWEWYEKNKSKMQLHPNTRSWLELKLSRIKFSQSMKERHDEMINSLKIIAGYPANLSSNPVMQAKATLDLIGLARNADD